MSSVALGIRGSAGRHPELARYTAVSIASTVVGVVLLAALVWTSSMSAGWANVVATIVSTAPCFELYRRWVWHRDDAAHIRAQVIPFAVVSLVGLALSTITASAADTYAVRLGWTGAGRTIAVEVGSNAAFAVLWVLQFVLFDRALFRSQRSDACNAPA